MLGIVGALAISVWLLVLVTWLAASPSADPRLVRATPFGRALRWYRAVWYRALAAVAGWPHLIDLLLGTSKTPVAVTPGEVVWSDGPATLTRYAGTPRHPEPVLVVHALVTRPWILDLAPGRSLVGALLEEGFDVFLLDWGDPGRAQASMGLAAHVDLLRRAERMVLDHSGAQRLHLVGYCGGGTLALARAAAFAHEGVGSLTAIAAPVDTAVPGGMRTALASRLLKPGLLLDGKGSVPAALVRESFHAIHPRALRSIVTRIRNRGDAGFGRIYGALARWVWEQRAVPGALFFDMVALFRTNGLYAGTLMLGEQRADLRTITAPVLVAVAERDHIVPVGSTHALTTVEGLRTETLACASGHVSMISGSAARTVLYPGLVAWLARQQPASAVRRVSSRSRAAGTRATARPRTRPARRNP